MSTRLAVFQRSLAHGTEKPSSRKLYLVPATIFLMYVIAACLMLSLNRLESHIQVLFGAYSLVLLLLLIMKGEYTQVIVTHNMQQAQRVSDYVAFIFLGNLVEASETAVLFNNPVNRETKEYISGKMG